MDTTSDGLAAREGGEHDPDAGRRSGGPRAQASATEAGR